MPAEPTWWYAEELRLAARLLQPLAAVVGTLGIRRFARTPYRSRLPVICVGNLTVGGAGKTPLAIEIGQRLIARGRRPAFLLRGYGGKERGPLRVDLARHSAADVGDEALLLARLAPTVVARQRGTGAMAIEALGTATADVIVMDDGFQNPALAKDLSLIVIDASRGIGNGRVLPAGPLRLPLAWQLARADAIVISGTPVPERLAFLQHNRLPLIATQTRPVAGQERLIGPPLVAFAGIGNPDKLFATLRGMGCQLVATRVYADHHPWTEADATDLIALGQRHQAQLVTTEKDLVRLANLGAQATLRHLASALAIELAIDPASAQHLELLLDRLFSKPSPLPAAP